MTLNLYFEEPTHVSTGAVPDILKIDVLIKLFFVSDDFTKILKTQTVSKQLPSQLDLASK